MKTIKNVVRKNCLNPRQKYVVYFNTLNVEDGLKKYIYRDGSSYVADIVKDRNDYLIKYQEIASDGFDVIREFVVPKQKITRIEEFKAN